MVNAGGFSAETSSLSVDKAFEVFLDTFEDDGRKHADNTPIVALKAGRI